MEVRKKASKRRERETERVRKAKKYKEKMVKGENTSIDIAPFIVLKQKWKATTFQRQRVRKSEIKKNNNKTKEF